MLQVIGEAFTNQNALFAVTLFRVFYEFVFKLVIKLAVPMLSKQP